ncbi:SMP-30/gluconolactonase/LRE family protein [Rhodococcus sp. AG1013]|uniref:SMP-30/gluconolactonase/LRE family protein n=1 Tax=unclassified Rhodococcus (in: high G+C Gram-positive bacteria) TaxID=192944 RepID=UPI00215D95DD|nr:SMP-30/gluconolactonase/LRE family protein [Rhodococcus sp. AG1013]
MCRNAVHRVRRVAAALRALTRLRSETTRAATESTQSGWVNGRFTAMGIVAAMTDITIETITTGLAFPECPRWREGRLWFSDIYRGVVLRLDPATGEVERVVEVPGQAGGLGFLPDGRLLVASVQERKVYRLEDDGTLTVHADLHGIAPWHLNDMAVDASGRAYVGNYGDDSAPPAPPFPADLAMVEPDGTAHVVATEMLFANGMVITPDGATLIVAETRASPGRLTAFTIEADGSLVNRRTLVEFDDAAVLPDGIALDAEGSVWVASPFNQEVIRVTAAGEVAERIAVPHPYAVALGGEDGRDLFVCTADTWVPEDAIRIGGGAIRRLRVQVPGAGF